MSTLLPPGPDDLRYAVYCRSDLFGLAHAPAKVAGTFPDKQAAVAYGQSKWPSTYIVIDLHGEDSPCGNRN